MPRILARAVACLAVLAAPLLAGNDGYFTTYNHHIEKGEVEVMLMADFTNPSDPKREEDDQRDYFSQMLEIEYAPTEQLALELMIEGFVETGTGLARFTGARYEARYRLWEREVPLNPMLYVEFEDLDLETRYKMEVSGWIHPPYEEDPGEEEPSREKILIGDHWMWSIGGAIGLSDASDDMVRMMIGVAF